MPTGRLSCKLNDSIQGSLQWTNPLSKRKEAVLLPTENPTSSSQIGHGGYLLTLPVALQENDDDDSVTGSVSNLFQSNSSTSSSYYSSSSDSYTLGKSETG